MNVMLFCCNFRWCFLCSLSTLARNSISFLSDFSCCSAFFLCLVCLATSVFRRSFVHYGPVHFPGALAAWKKTPPRVWIALLQFFVCFLFVCCCCFFCFFCMVQSVLSSFSYLRPLGVGVPRLHLRQIGIHQSEAIQGQHHPLT